MCADGDAAQTAVILRSAMIFALFDGAFNAVVRLAVTSHVKDSSFHE